MSNPRVIAPVIRQGKNTTSAALVKGKLVNVKASNTVDDEVEDMDATDTFFGVVAETSIAVGAYGDIQTEGRALVLAGGSVAVGDKVASDASGDGVTASAGTTVVGTAMTAGTDGELFEVELNKGEPVFPLVEGTGITLTPNADGTYTIAVS